PDDLLERRAALRERRVEQRRVGAREDVEGHERRRHLLGEAGDARGRGVDALLQRLEVLAAAVGADHELAVEDVAALREAQLGEVAPERLAVARLDEEVAS